MGRLSGRNSVVLDWLFILVILISAYLISHFEDLNRYFILFLIFQIAFGAFYSNRFQNSTITISRIILGLVFIYSGTVKGIDPLGTEYRIDDYFIAYGTEWAMGVSLPLSVLLNASEFIIGILLIFNINIRITSWLLAAMMAVFTVVTINDALYSPVPDCGCFGDALILSNWQTLYKNLVIDVLVLVIFFNRNRVKRSFKPVAEWTVLLIFGILFIGFEVYNIRHLPMLDFRDWKVGNKMINDNPLPLKYYLTYRNIETGEEQEYVSPDYPYNDSVWLSEWEFVKQRIEDPNPRLHDLLIEDTDGFDVTGQIIENPDVQFILVAFDLNQASYKNIDYIQQFISSCNVEGHSFAILTASFIEDIESFQNKFNLETDFYLADDIELMAMIRSNPGLILLRDGVILEKWHNNDFPEYEEVNKNYLSNDNKELVNN